jgi:two-component system nitrate/nitrite response regulator NarL
MIRLLLVDDSQLTCNILAAVLDEEPDITVVSCAIDADDALTRAQGCDVALVSTGAASPAGTSGSVALVRAIKQAAPAIKVLILGLTESEDQVLPYVQAGAFGYVLADDSVDDLLARIRTACEDKAVISPDIAAALIARLGELSRLAASGSARMGQPGSDNGKPNLTPREVEILSLIERGFTNQAIATKLMIQVGTVKNHVHNILQKLEVGSREDAAAVASLRSGTSVASSGAAGK